MTIDLELLQKLSNREQKTMLERFLKLSEECGELAQEILIERDVSGFQYKKKGEDGCSGEAVDVLLVAFSIYFKTGGSIDELIELINKKCEKWQKHQKLN